MEWSPEKVGVPYTAPVSIRTWLDTLGASVALFLAEKKLLPNELVPPLDDILKRAAAAAATSETASLAFLTLRNRAEKLSLASRLDAALAESPRIAQARQLGI
jgi:hypothetical protein